MPKEAKKKFRIIYKVLAQGSTVRKLSPITIVKKEPNKPEVRVRKSDIANLAQNMNGEQIGHSMRKEHRQRLTNNVGKHSESQKGLFAKIRPGKQADDVSVISSARLGKSTTRNIVRAIKMRIPTLIKSMMANLETSPT